KAEVASLEDARDKQLSDIKIKVQGFILLIVLFTLLLANFIAFSSLNSSNANLLEKVSRFAQNTNAQQNINEEVKKKEAQLQALGWDGAINKSSLIDQVSSLLPSEVSLTEIAINPVDLAGSRTNKSLMFYNRKMHIIGNSQKIIPVNEWIARIKSRKWVKNVQMESFTYDNELNTGRFNITIDY
ncbi:MAG TPA: PilN domain-containing protein, partial [Mucilaginibacter sp.]|nr:PilN domain-containing protein [Mucilaginibacter sp.]